MYQQNNKANVCALRGRFLFVDTGFPRTSEHEQETSMLFLRMYLRPKAKTLAKNAAKVLQIRDIGNSKAKKD